MGLRKDKHPFGSDNGCKHYMVYCCAIRCSAHVYTMLCVCGGFARDATHARSGSVTLLPCIATRTTRSPPSRLPADSSPVSMTRPTYSGSAPLVIRDLDPPSPPGPRTPGGCVPGAPAPPTWKLRPTPKHRPPGGPRRSAPPGCPPWASKNRNFLKRF